MFTTRFITFNGNDCLCTDTGLQAWLGDNNSEYTILY